MKFQKLQSAFLLAIGMVMLAVGAQPATVFAAPKGAAPATNNNPSVIKISPLRTDITLKPGETGKVSVIVTNVTDTPIALKPIENDFVAGDENGTPAVILDERSYAPTHSLKRFMVPISTITISPHEDKMVDVTIKVPATAQAGGYFGALRFAPADASESGSVNLGASVVSLILLTVPGDLVENLMLQNFSVEQDGGTSNNFRSPDGLSALMRFKNTGNVQVAPFGVISVKKGDKVVYKKTFNSEQQKDNVLPDSTRKWTVPLKNLGKFGKYTVTGNFTYGTSNQTIETTKTIWIIPSLYIWLALGGIALIVILILALTAFLKSYKKRVLRSARRY